MGYGRGAYLFLGDMTDDQALLAFEIACQAKGLKDETVKWYLQILGYLKRAADNKPLLLVTHIDIQKYVLYLIKNRKPKTVNDYIRVFNVFYRFLFSEGLIDTNPMARIGFIKEPKRIRSVIKPEQFSLALRQFNKQTFTGYRDYVMALIAYDCCLRNSEIRGITLDDVSFNPQRTICVIGKGDKERIVPFSPKTATKLITYLRIYRKDIPGNLMFPTSSGSAVSIFNLKRSFRQAGDKVGLHMNPHALRHSGATQWYKITKDIRFVQYLLGHSDIRTTQIYLHTGLAEASKYFETHSVLSGIAV